MIILSGLFIAVWAGLISRGAYLQLVSDERLDRLRDRQFQTVISLQPRRGSILDRRGRELALSMTSYSLYADPQLVRGPRAVARQLAPILGMSKQTIEAKIKDKDKRFVWISRQLPEEKANKIRALGLKGVSFVEESSRFYPHEDLMAPLLGLVGSEGQGLEGLELRWDSVLQGNRKKVSVRRDARGRPLIADGRVFGEAPEGGEIQLTVDSSIQHFVEQELRLTTEEFDASQAFGVVLDANTSAVVAMAMTHNFDANKAAKIAGEHRRAKILTDTFEPGSVMKTFTIAAALREKLIAPNTRYNTEGGRMKVGDYFIREADQTHKWAQLTVSEILAFSSNVGTSKIAFDLGADALRQALDDFGFGQKTGVELPGDARGTLLPLPWHQHLLANVAIGQGIAVSALQMANAYAAIANGGTLRQPYIVSSVRNAETGETVYSQPKDIRRVLSPEDAASMRMILAGVTAPGGTGVSAKVEGFTVGGKTGTAQKASSNSRGYMPGAYVSSFAGFFPVHDPKYVIYVVVDHPKKSYYGSQVAAPLFAKIAGSIARTEGMAPVSLSARNLSKPEQALGKSATKKRKLAAESEAATESENIARNEEILKTALAQGVVPPLEGLTVRELVRVLKDSSLELRIKGEGRVSYTYPAAGEQIFRDRKLVIMLK